MVSRTERFTRGIASLLVLTLITATSCFAQQHERGTDSVRSSGEWNIYVLQNTPTMFDYRWFALDAFNEELHILFFHTNEEHTSNYLMYGHSTDNGMTWEYDTIDGRQHRMVHVDNLFSMATTNGALAVDHCGVPHLFYTVNYFHTSVPAQPSWAIHARKIDGLWLFDTVEARDSTQIGIAFDIDMVIGSDNEPRVVYIHGENEPMYGVSTGSGWKIEPIDVLRNGRYLYASLALDRRNNPHVALGKYYGLEYAVGNHEGWRSQDVQHEAFGPDIALDTADRPHMVFSTPISKPYYHSTWTEKGWTKDLMESNVVKGSENTKRARIKRDPDGILHAVYYGHNEIPASHYLIYAFSIDNGRTWKEELVEYARGIYGEGNYPDIVITDKLIGVFYKGDGNVPRFAYRTHSKPHFRKSKRNYCGQDDPGYRSGPDRPTSGDR